MLTETLKEILMKDSRIGRKSLEAFLEDLKKEEEILTQQKANTVGEYIAQTNESLADFLTHCDNDMIGSYYCRYLCDHRNDTNKCDDEDCSKSDYTALLAFLNQPYADVANWIKSFY